MAEKKKNSQKKTTGGKGRWANLNKTSKILYTVAVIVILVPLLFLGYIISVPRKTVESQP